MLSRTSNLGGGKFGVENAGENAISKFLNLGGISNLGGRKFGVENAISNLEFWGVENLGWKMLESRI